ncbi:DUF6089 family protein [Echinicola sp. 20G]|uniref:DUF6089 family protein n=1 Tax=Echinicola sp. 20G TaxID=2781961 RepID=UPI001F32F59E|nr:DUF6089 family protein [Echinicola sp. 20G]
MILKPIFCLLFLMATFAAGSLSAQNFYRERIPRIYSLHIAAGPGSIYADNGGPYRNFEFPISGAVTVAAAKKLNHRINLRASMGFQHVNSNVEHFSDRAFEWGEENKAYAFQGNAFYLDIMPEFYFIPFETHIMRSRFNGYAGVGLGFLAVPGEQAVASNNQNNVIINKTTPTSLYVPLRIGGTMAFGNNWDIGFEASLLTALSDELDGNAGSNTTNDMLMQGQFFVKRYLSPFPFWKKWFAK